MLLERSLQKLLNQGAINLLRNSSSESADEENEKVKDRQQLITQTKVVTMMKIPIKKFYHHGVEEEKWLDLY